MTDKPGEWVVRSLEKRGAHVHLERPLLSRDDGHVVLSTGEEFDSELIVWTVGNAREPDGANHTDLPIDARGMLIVRADLRVGTDEAPVPDAWGAGDDAAVPDLARRCRARATVPNAQHAVRQGKRSLAEHRRHAARREPKRLRAPQPRRRRDARPRARHLPVPAPRHQGLARPG